MASTDKLTTTAGCELVLTRIIDAQVFKAWTDPTLLEQSFAPVPRTKSVAETAIHQVDRASSSCRAYAPILGNHPKKSFDRDPYFRGGKTNYTVRMRPLERRRQRAHEKISFHQGWS